MANVIKVALLDPTNANFVAALQENSKALAAISQQFVERVASLRIRTFYETEKFHNHLVCICFVRLASLPLADLSPPQVVDRDSARLGLANEIAVGIAGADHMTMCKFNDINSQKYSTVWRAIKSLSDVIANPPDSCMYILLEMVNFRCRSNSLPVVSSLSSTHRRGERVPTVSLYVGLQFPPTTSSIRG